MLSTWVTFLQIKAASVGDNFGRSRSNDDTKGCTYMFQTSGNSLIRHHVGRLVGIEHTGCMKARHATTFFKLIRL
jgi:hypothetical protein